MANLKKKEQQISENVLIRDIKRADCIKRGSKYRNIKSSFARIIKNI